MTAPGLVVQGRARLLTLGLALAFMGCGEDPADVAFRELVGEWTMDTQASIDATVEGFTFGLFRGGPQTDAVRARAGAYAPRLRLVIQRDGSAYLENAEMQGPGLVGATLVGVIEDGGRAFFVHFRSRQGPPENQDARVTFEVERRDARLHGWVVGADGEGADEIKRALGQLGVIGALHFVFDRAPPERAER